MSPGTMTIHFEGRLDPARRRRAQRLALRGALPLWALYGLTGLALAAGSVLAFLLDRLVAGALVFSLGVLASLVLTLYEVVVRRTGEADLPAGGRVEGALDEEALRITSPGGRAEIPWERFERWKAGRGLLLVYESSRRFHVLAPDLFATPEDWRAARALVAGKVPSTRTADRRRLLWAFLAGFAGALVALAVVLLLQRLQGA